MHRVRWRFFIGRLQASAAGLQGGGGGHSHPPTKGGGTPNTGGSSSKSTLALPAFSAIWGAAQAAATGAGQRR